MDFIVLIARSASPLHCRYLELLVCWVIPFDLVNSANTSIGNWGALFETISPGSYTMARHD